MKFKYKFIIGIALILANYPLGWLGLAGFHMLAIKLQKPVLHLVGLGLYGLSWAMYGLGLLLAGPEGVRWLRDRLRGLVRVWGRANP